MDVNLLSKMVLELAVDHDEIGLPGLGCFKAEIVPASFSDRGYTVNPPFRRLVFLQEETSDSSLVDFYAAQNRIKKEDARTILESFFRDFTKQVVETRDVLLPGVGRLRAMAGGRMLFVCDPEFNVFPDGFGLEPVSLRNTRPDSPTTGPIPASGPTPVVEPAPIIEPAPDADPVPVIEPAPTPEPESAPGTESTGHSKVLIVLLTVLTALLLAVAALRLAGTYFPEVIDKILYTPEELQIIYY